MLRYNSTICHRSLLEIIHYKPTVHHYYYQGRAGKLQGRHYVTYVTVLLLQQNAAGQHSSTCPYVKSIYCKLLRRLCSWNLSIDMFQHAPYHETLRRIPRRGLCSCSSSANHEPRFQAATAQTAWANQAPRPWSIQIQALNLGQAASGSQSMTIQISVSLHVSYLPTPIAYSNSSSCSHG